jgi:hypothetical protein
MAISIVTGLPGMGKTLKLTEFGVKAMNRGRRVYANFRMKNLPRPELYTHFNDPLEVLGKVSKGLILMSEVGILLDSYKVWELPHEVWDELRQHRKDGVDIICDAQSMNDTATKFRRLVQKQYHIYRKISLPCPVFGYVNEKGKRVFTFLAVHVRNPQPKGEYFGRDYWIHNPYYFHFYDTEYKLEKTPTLADIAQERIQSPWAEYEYARYLDLTGINELK